MEQETFCRILNTYTKTLLVIAFNYCRNRQDAEDIVQEVFVKLYCYAPVFVDDAHLRNWLIRVTINKSKDFLRSPWRRLHAPIESAREALSNPYETDCTVFDAVMALPQKYREVVVLYYYEEYSTAEISSLLHRKLTTVQTQLMRARARLKEILEEVWNDESDSAQLSDS